MPIEFTAVELNHWGIRWVKVGATLRTLELIAASQAPLDPLPETTDLNESASEADAESVATDSPPNTTETVGPDSGEVDEEALPEPVPASARPDDDGLAPWSEIERRQIITLRRLVEQSHIPGEFVVTMVPGTAVTARLASFPFDKRGKIEQVLKTEVDSRLPYDIDDIISDFVMIGKLGATTPEDTETPTSVIAFSAFKGAVSRTLRLFRAAGIELRQISALPAALAALPARSEPAGPQIRVYLGERETTATVVDNGRPLSVRTIPVGLMTSLSNWDATEEQKARYLLSLEDPSFALSPGEPVPDHSAYLRRITKDLSAAIKSFEIQFSLGISSVSWFGPGSMNHSVIRYLTAELALPTGTLLPDNDTLGTLGFPSDRPPELWALVNSLVLRLARPEKCPIGINLRREEFTYRSRFRDLGEKLLPATYFLVAAILLYVVSTMVGIRSLQEKLVDSRVRVAETYRQNTGKDLQDYNQAVATLQSELAVKERLLEVMNEISGVSILNHLAEISRSIKSDVKIDTDSLSVERDRVILDARTADYNTLGAIEGYFSKHPFYRKVEIRNTRRLPDGKVGFRMELYMSSEEEQAKALSEQQKQTGQTTPDASGAVPAPDESTDPIAEPLDEFGAPNPIPAETVPGTAPMTPENPPVSAPAQEVPRTPEAATPSGQQPPNQERPGRKRRDRDQQNTQKEAR